MLWKYAGEAQPGESPVPASGSIRPGTGAGSRNRWEEARCTARGAGEPTGGTHIQSAVRQEEAAGRLPAGTEAEGALAEAPADADGRWGTQEGEEAGRQHTDPGEDSHPSEDHTHSEAADTRPCEAAGSRWSSGEMRNEDRSGSRGLQEVAGGWAGRILRKSGLRSSAGARRTWA